ncbi:DUF1289 domain-containing protein [Rhodoferax sediminis]|uniref:DUF1289 domain-containing protein n=1 Tax=Rhodoferax sediminis TaxID=2509614 RepID=A0A515D752_9BURK|nr:DUF1289 domain-containing protein [Rhodoferax sediminis]QDL36240.1 DUF1289 domain-containing protein [Rhodoferax sediminis]
MNAIDPIAHRADVARAAAENVPSPCISVCRMSEAGGWCEGCFRTLDEIGRWSRMSDADKRAIWALIEQRAAAESTTTPASP